jgi:hypothetical protein
MNAVQKIPPIRSTMTRVYRKDFRENQNITFDLPLDTVLVGMIIRLVGSVKYAYTAGTPFGRPEGAMESLFSRIDVTVDGRRTVKSVTPHMLHMMQLMTAANESERFAEAGATAIQDNYPATEGPFVFGTTGQVTTVRESVYLPFEMLHCEPGMGRELTYLNLKRANSAQLTLQALNYPRLNAASGVTGLAFSEEKLQVEITLIERQDIDATVVFQDYKQTFKRLPLTGQLNAYGIDIPAGASIAGFMLYTQNGNVATPSVPAKAPSSKILGVVEIKKNGRDTLQIIDFKTLQSRNRADYGIISPTVAAKNRLDGVAHLNLISRRDLSTAFINMKEYGVDSLQLVIESKAAGIVDYTQPAELLILTEEIV